MAESAFWEGQFSSSWNGDGAAFVLGIVPQSSWDQVSHNATTQELTQQGCRRIVTDRPLGAQMTKSKTLRFRADFNELFREFLCLSHEDTCEDVDGNLVTLRTGMALTAFDEDADENGNRDDLIASGIVEPSPQWLRCNGSRWSPRIDQHGVRHESDLQSST
jgi:hypothetical protein